MTSARLPTGGQVDRGRPLAFTFDGKPYSGFAGDSIASALLANGVRVVGRSFKYHRPRGVWGAWTEEPNAIVDVTRSARTTPNLRATTEPLENDLAVRSVNAMPTAAADRAALIDRLAPVLPAGFYYKTFLWPRWETFEGSIRAMAGLGRVDPNNRPPADNPQFSARCDLLVVGAGPAGLAAAAAAARAGRGVFLLDDHADIGGRLAHRGGAINGGDWRDWALSVARAVEAAGGRVLTRTTAYGVYDGNLVCAWERRIAEPDALWRLRPKRIVIAAGAIERPLILPDNDRPGVMSADAALVYLKRYAVLVGKRVVVATNNDSAYAVAEALAEAGAGCRNSRHARRRPGKPIARNARATVEHVIGTRGVEAVRIAGKTRDCDALLVSGGWSPTVHLYGQARGKLRYDEGLAALVPMDGVEGLTIVGAANGAFTLAEALREGHEAGGGEGAAPNAPASQYAIQATWPKADDEGRRWIDFQNDVTFKDVALAAREGYVSVEHLKRYTTLGMATDQGKTANVNGIAAMAGLTGRTIDETGTTTYRPPFAPVPMGVIAGRRRGALINPLRRLPLEAEHRAAGAQLREYGGWLRPAWHGTDEPERAIQREAALARDTVAVFDGSSLGKIEIIGPDAAALADFHSYNRLSTLQVWPDPLRLCVAGVGRRARRRRHAAAWRQIAFLSPARRVIRMRCARVSNFGARTASTQPMSPFTTRRRNGRRLRSPGPRSRDLIGACGLDLALDDEALPHMAFTTGAFDGAPLRLARVSFTGDRAYEFSVPARRAVGLRARLFEKLNAFGGGLLGLEALMILRAEKGYIVVGKDTDGTTMPHDLGFAGPRDSRTDEYIGKRSLFMPVANDPRRKQLVGLSVATGEKPLPTGAHVTSGEGRARRSQGYVTSSYFSPNLGRPIALGLVEAGLSRIGEAVSVYHLGTERRATIAVTVAFDPEGQRLHA